MKQCHMAAVVLAIVIALVVANAVYIHHITGSLTAELDALPTVPEADGTPQAVAVLRKRLQSHAGVISLSVNYTVTDRAIEALYSLEAFARAGDNAQYEATKAALRDYLEDLGRLERLSIENIF